MNRPVIDERGGDEFERRLLEICQKPLAEQGLADIAFMIGVGQLIDGGALDPRKLSPNVGVALAQYAMLGVAQPPEPAEGGA